MVSKKPEILFRSIDHPEANGGKPIKGEVEYVLRVPLEDGRELVLRLGQKGFDAITQVLMDMLTNAPSHSDGSTNAC